MRDNLVRRLTTATTVMEPSRTHSARSDACRTPHIPPELIDHILGYLHPEPLDDPVSVQTSRAGWRERERRMRFKMEDIEDPQVVGNDLAACRLVSRAWSGIALAHLFHDVAFVVRQRNRGTRPNKTLADFKAFLQSCSIISSYIQRLRLEYPDQYAHLPVRSTVKLDPIVLLEFLSLVPNLRSLHLCNVQLGRPPVPRDNESASDYRLLTLQSLQISYHLAGQLWPVPDGEYVMLLGLFSRIVELRVTGMGIVGHDTGPADYSGGPAQLGITRLVVERTHNGPVLFAHLRDGLRANTIRSLVVEMVSGYDDGYEMLKKREFLELVGPGIEELEIYLSRSLMPYGTNVIDISSFSNLRRFTLGFRLPLFLSPTICQHTLTHVVRSFSLDQLSRNTHPRLEELTLVIALGAPRPTQTPLQAWILPHTVYLNRVDQKLVEVVKATGLPGVTIEYVLKKGIDNIDAVLQRMFPILKQMSVVNVRQPPRPRTWRYFVETSVHIAA